jgi:hypothetical protein
MIWTTIPFGKHQGKTLPQIVIDDPDWFFWVLPGLYGQLKIEADDLARKASKIDIPRRNPRKWCVEFRFEHGYRFLGFETRGQLRKFELVDQTAVRGFEAAAVLQGI